MYYVTFDCEVCDATVHYGPCATLLEHNGRPVVTVDVLSQERVDCDDCGARHYFGDVDVYVEGRDEEIEDDD